MYSDGLWNSLWGFNPDDNMDIYDYQDDYEIFCDACEKIKFERLAISKSFCFDLSQQKKPFLNAEALFLGNDSLDIFYSSNVSEKKYEYKKDHEFYHLLAQYLKAKLQRSQPIP